MIKEVMDRWPNEINKETLAAYIESLQCGITHHDPGEEPIGADTLKMAQKYKRALLRGLYVIMYISDQAKNVSDPGYQFKIHSNDTALEVMTRCRDEMVNDGALSRFCYKNPSKQMPYAWQGNNKNPSSIIDWRAGFRRWELTHVTARK